MPINCFDLEWSYTFIYLISCLHLPTNRSKAAIVSEISIVSLFPTEKPKLPKLTLLQCRIWSTGSLFEQTMMGQSHQSYKPSFVEIGQLRRRFLKSFTIYGRDGHLSYVTKDAANKLSFPLSI